ncbi:shikimate kinase [Alphaproteobacteria bacterium GH1-50]|uniref:Shikimate kinase n=1 Tax=Kangsaoukella pontilimi TaxID=2691042 RepID=A0A7C9MUN2_9RHOB|nr:shikimate kinase [Kangsaoukella pontilimi]MXQ06274.1 shikimate kinase [Kangsaoukella pontilimi]
MTPFRASNRKDKRDAAVLPFKLKKTVALVGMMGSGKSAIGQALARRLDVPFLDSDAEIVAAANMSIAEIFARDGESFFRRKETQVIQRLLKGTPGILSTGGGAYLKERNREAIAARGVAVWLRADIDLLWNRVRHKTTRPLLMTDNPRRTLEELYAARVPEYAKAEIAVDADPGFSIEEMTDRVVEALLSRPDILEVQP